MGQGQRKKSSVISDAYWLKAKPMIEDLYLVQNKGAKDITTRLWQEYGVEVTARQLKTKFKNWGYDDKRIDGRAYQAMHYVMEERCEDMDFQVVRRRGCSTRVKPACEIRKEVKRQKIDKTLPKWKTAAEALEFLRCRKIEPVKCYSSAMLTQLSAHQGPSQEVEFNVVDRGDAHSITSEDTQSDSMEPTPLNVNFPDDSYQQQRPAFNLADSSLDTALRPRIWYQLPNPNQFTMNLHSNVLPQTIENEINNTFGEPKFSRSRNDTEPTILLADELLEDLTLSLADMTLQFDLNDSRRKPWEKFLGVELERHYRHPSREDNRLIVEFVAYYIQQTLAGFDTLDEYDHIDRKEARTKLRQMLEAGNQQILAAINWISAVIGSHDKGEQLAAFYEDCYACVGDNNCYVARVVKPAIEFALSTYGENQRTPENLSASPKSRDKRHQALAQNFDGEREFNQSLSLLEQHGHQDSPMHLTLRYHYAWYLLQKGDATKALSILVRCANSAERLMGCKHLVTVNCYAMAARAYSQLGDSNLARNDLGMAMSRLTHCPNPLRAYKYRLLERQALIDIEGGDHTTALYALDEVFAFRLENLGPCSGSTWGAATKIFEVLEQLGQGAEADRRRKKLEQEYEREWYRQRGATA